MKEQLAAGLSEGKVAELVENDEVNMSGDAEQEYFADGMVEEIITALSRIRWLIVIARNSSFTYKGQAVDVKQVGRELGVRYVLEGSVRKAGATFLEGGVPIGADRDPTNTSDITALLFTSYLSCAVL
jgi:adenylate cyclase